MICHPQPGADGVRLDRLPNADLVRNRVLRIPINTKEYGSHGQSIWMRPRLNRSNRMRRLQTSHPWWI